jgi:hypothetical protein
LNFLKTSFKFIINLLQTSYKLLTNFIQTSYKLLSNFFINLLQTSYKLLTNFLQTSYKLHTNFLQTSKAYQAGKRVERSKVLLREWVEVQALEAGLQNCLINDRDCF